jgi:hypothetical protein
MTRSVSFLVRSAKTKRIRIDSILFPGEVQSLFPRLAGFICCLILLGNTSGLAAQETEPPAPEQVAPEQDAQATPPPIDETETPEPVTIPQVPQAELQLRDTPFPVDQFVFRYAREHPQHPDWSSLEDVEVELGVTTTGYIAPREGFPSTTIRIGDVPNLELRQFYFSSMNTVFAALVDRLKELDLISVYIAADPQELSPNSPYEDFRPVGESQPLTVLVITAVINQTRTLAFGERIPDVERENNPLHQRIIDRSPLKSWDGQSERSDLLRRNELDDYLARLNRLPGRRVDAAIAAVDKQPGEVSLDFLVSENNLLQLYSQVSNTGTEQTDDWRMRFGLIMNQFTNNDDILSIEYVTAGFDESHAVIGDYTSPIGDSDVMWWEVNGFWSDYTASDVGFANEQFSGESWSAGGDLVFNIYQNKEFFLDLVAGARWLNVEVTNDIVDIEGESDFFLPRVGVRWERRTSVVSTEGLIHVEWNEPDVADTDEDELDELGRLFVSGAAPQSRSLGGHRHPRILDARPRIVFPFPRAVRVRQSTHPPDRAGHRRTLHRARLR